MLEGMDPEADEIRKRLAKLPMRGNKRQYTAAVKQAVAATALAMRAVVLAVRAAGTLRP